MKKLLLTQKINLNGLFIYVKILLNCLMNRNNTILFTHLKLLSILVMSIFICVFYKNAQRDLVSAAVVDGGGMLLGRITVDDVVDVIQEEAEYAVRVMAGLGEDDMFAPVITSTKRRALWLGINLATAFLASWVIGRFEETIQQLVTLAILMPIVAGMGGIAGSQTLTIAIRGIALGQINRSNAKLLMYKECAVGILNGIMWACVVSVIVILWFQNLPLGIIIGLAMIINLIIAALAGALIPLGLKHFHIDPAIAGGVLLTTITDVVGFMTFLGLATIFLLA